MRTEEYCYVYYSLNVQVAGMKSQTYSYLGNYNYIAQ